MSGNHTREMELAIKDKAKMSENYLKEIESLNRQLNAALRGTCRAGRVNGGTIVLCRERTERSRTIPSFRKKTNA